MPRVVLSVFGQFTTTAHVDCRTVYSLAYTRFDAGLQYSTSFVVGPSYA